MDRQRDLGTRIIPLRHPLSTCTRGPSLASGRSTTTPLRRLDLVHWSCGQAKASPRYTGSQCSHALSRLPRWGNASRPAALAADAAFLPGLRHGQGHTSVSYNYQVCTTHGERPWVEVQREARARRGRRSGDEVEHRQVGGLGSRLDRDLMLEATLKCLSRALSASHLALSHTPTRCLAAQH